MQSRKIVVAAVVLAAACGGNVQYDGAHENVTASGVPATGGAPMTGVGGVSGLAPNDVGGFGGLPFSGYCAGSTAKVQYKGRTLSPKVSYDQTSNSLGCCQTYGIDLQTSADLGFDFQLRIIVPNSGIPPYPVCYTNDPDCPQANLTASNNSNAIEPAAGTIRLDPDPTGAKKYDFGVCVEVDDNASNLVGTKVFVPGAGGGTYH